MALPQLRKQLEKHVNSRWAGQVKLNSQHHMT